MPTDRGRLEETIFQAIDQVNQLLLPEQRLTKSPDTALTGNETTLDSLGLVNLIVAVERNIEENFGVGVVLVSEESMSLPESPFRKVSALADYAKILIEKKLNGRSGS